MRRKSATWWGWIWWLGWISGGILFGALISGCSIGGQYTPEGPHPHVNAAVALHVGPLEVLHSSASNAKPVTDITVATVNLGPTFGAIQPTIGLGWQWSRLWGAPCGPTGHDCPKTWTNGYAVAAGITYRAHPFRVDLRALSYDNSPVGADVNLPLGIEALVLLFGFDL